MNNIIEFFEFFLSRKEEIIKLIFQHLEITIISVSLGIVIGVPLGLLICKNEKVSKSILFILGILQTIPSLAFFGFIIPILGIGLKPAIFVLFIYGLLPIVTNTCSGIKSIDKSILEAGLGMGMTSWNIVNKIEIPLAFPIIMGGIKISTISNIGTATIAALIGAGGLGEAIFRGISTNNSYLILCGAIPAALLAILANYFLGHIECRMKSGKSLRAYLLIPLLILSYIIFNKFQDLNKKTIIIGHKNYTEQRILGQLYRILIEQNSDYKVKVVELGGGSISFQALMNNNIDMYPEYTGSIYSNILKESGLKNSEEVYNYVKKKMDKKYNLLLLDKLKFSNTYTFVLKSSLAEKSSLKNISDLPKVCNYILLGGDSEFYEREDGLVGLEKGYGIVFKNKIHMDTGLVFKAINSDKIDIGVVYSTDGGIQKYNLITLKDDKSFFPPYNIVPIVRRDFGKNNPEILEIINTFGGKITEEEIQKMNYLVTEENISEEYVAESFLKKEGYIEMIHNLQ